MNKKLTLDQSNLLIQAKILYGSAKQKILISCIDSIEIAHFNKVTDKLIAELNELLGIKVQEDGYDDSK